MHFLCCKIITTLKININTTRPNTAQPMDRPNPWTTLGRRSSVSFCFWQGMRTHLLCLSHWRDNITGKPRTWRRRDHCAVSLTLISPRNSPVFFHPGGEIPRECSWILVFPIRSTCGHHSFIACVLSGFCQIKSINIWRSYGQEYIMSRFYRASAYCCWRAILI